MRAYAMMNANAAGYADSQHVEEAATAAELKDVMTNAKPGTKVKLAADIDLGDVAADPVVLADKVTLDLNGKKIAAKSSKSEFAFVVNNGCEAVMQNGELQIVGRGIKVDGGKLVCKNIRAAGLTQRFAAAYGNEETRTGAELVIDKDCFIEGDTTDQLVGVYGFETHAEGKDDAVIKCTIAGNVINKNEDPEHSVAPVSTYGSDIWSTTEITVEDGAVIETANKREAAFYLPGKGTLVLNGGIIRGGTGIYTKGAEIVIPAGSKVKVIATAAGDEVEDASFNGNGHSCTGDCISIDNCNTNGKDGAEAIYAVPAKHSIAGGEFISANGKEIGSYATSREGLSKREKFTKFITGGKFAHEVDEELVAEGKTCKADGDAYVIS